ncbi:MAG: ribosomal protein S18-alanine N-acetyltransferase [Fervidicoccaceae archaeon]
MIAISGPKCSGLFKIRRASLEDLPAVIEINRSSLPENYPFYFFREHLENWPEAFLVAEIEGKVVGYVMCRVEVGFGHLNKVPMRRGHVISLAVAERYRRLGIGTALMKEAIEALKNVYKAREVYLEVRVSNKPAISLYEKLGFEVTRRIPAYYHDGEDAFLMARAL